MLGMQSPFYPNLLLSLQMPEFYIRAYQAQLDGMKPFKVKDELDKLNTWLDEIWDDKCLKTLRELPCMPMYCSETDEKIIQIRNKRKDCDTALAWYVIYSLYNATASILIIDTFIANLKYSAILNKAVFLKKNLETFQKIGLL